MYPRVEGSLELVQAMYIILQSSLMTGIRKLLI